MAEALRAERANGVSWARPLSVAFYAEACAETGWFATGLDALSKILAVVENNEERKAEAEPFRVRGLIERKLGLRDEAEMSLRRALATARGQQAKFWELRAGDLAPAARAWAARGGSRDAGPGLCMVHGRIRFSGSARRPKC
jgi:hypothetical protein